MLWLNFLRALKGTLPRLVSVILITAIAVTVYAALGGITYNVRRICDQYYTEQNVADYWITGTNLDRADCRTLLALPGVTGVQPRVSLEVQEKGDSAITLALYAVPDTYEMNTPYLIAGSLPQSDREMVVSDEFARANGLAVGDWYDMTFPASGAELHLQISGLVKSPELIRNINAATPSADLARHGFAYCSDTAAAVLMGENRYNQICLTVDGSCSDEELRLPLTPLEGENRAALRKALAAWDLVEE